MRTAVKRSYRYSPEDTAMWLQERMNALGISGLEELRQLTGIDRGSLSRYFRQERVPKIDVIGPLCEALRVSPETLLVALGAIESKSKN